MFKTLTLSLLGVALTVTTASVFSDRFITPLDQTESGYSFVDDQLLRSSRYTQPDESNPTLLDTYHQQFKLSFTEEQRTAMGYQLMLENDSIKVYFEKDSFSVLLENKANGYLWSSRPEYQGYSQTREDNTASRNLMNSGLWIDYVRLNNISNAAINTASLYTLADVSYANNGALDLTQLDLTYPYILEPYSYKTARVQTAVKDITANGFTVEINIKTLSIAFDVQLSLSEAGFSAELDPATVIESGEVYRLLSVSLFPYLGATREDRYPGYFVIPDGVGTLIRTNRRYDTAFQADFYGSDVGYGRTSIAQLSLPMYGVVHESGENALYGYLVSGAEHSSLNASFWGRNTRYQRIGTEFHLRKIYRQLINQAGDGFDTIAEAFVEQPLVLRWQVLDGPSAQYVGIANAFSSAFRIDHQIAQTMNVSSVPVQLSYIMTEQEPTFFGTSQVVMTTYQDVQSMTETFAEAGIDHQAITLSGWSNDGFMYRAPYSLSFYDRSGLEQTVESLPENAKLYLQNDYVISSELSRRVSRESDVAKNYSKVVMEQTLRRLGSDPLMRYWLKPETSHAKWMRDAATYETLGVGAMMESIGQTLFSYYDDARMSRSDSLAHYQTLLSESPANLLSSPNAYALRYADGYVNMPVTNAQYDYYTDVAPIVPLVLKGWMPSYTPYLNFNALGIDRLLQMVDFGVFPSYILTEQPSPLMRYTYANLYYTTTRSDFETDIIDTFEFLQGALSSVLNATVVSRIVVKVGLVYVSYDNGVTIAVNYAPYAQEYLGQIIDAQSYEVLA